MGTYTVPDAVASRAEERLMFLACSRTLDLASSMDELELAAAVERQRTRVMPDGFLETVGTRIVEGVSGMASTKRGRAREVREEIYRHRMTRVSRGDIYPSR